MEVILKKDVKGTGKEGQIVKVSDGFARNKLIPGGFAVEATEANKRAIAREKAKAAEKYAADKAAAEEMARKLTAAPVVVKTKVGDKGSSLGQKLIRKRSCLISLSRKQVCSTLMSSSSQTWLPRSRSGSKDKTISAYG